MKTCVDCGNLTNRHINALRCDACRKKRKQQISRDWYKAHPDKRWHRLHPEAAGQRAKEIYNADPDKFLAKHRRWKERNRDHLRAYMREYRRKQREARRVIRLCQAEGCTKTLGKWARKFCNDCGRFYDTRRPGRASQMRKARQLKKAA